MALRQLLIARQLTELRAKKDELAKAIAEVEGKRAAWRERESRAEAALAELTDESSAEERAAFDAEAAEIEEEDKAITADEEANAAELRGIEEKITALEAEAEEIKKRGQAATAAASEQRKENRTMETRRVPGVSEEVREICRDSEVRDFLGEIRAKRAVNNATYTIPTIMLPLVISAIERSSKLLKHVNRTVLKGDGVINLLAEAPEAVWTATIGKINEVNLSFYQIQSFGSKLGAWVGVPNPYLADSDENLAAIVIDQLGQAHGYGLDKAILYGDGANKPVGIMTRLAATTAPTWWQTRMPAFTNVSATNVGKLSAASVTGAALFKELMAKLGAAEEKYNAGSGDLFWAMKRSTYMKLQSELLSINAAGSVVTGAQMQMPIIGGVVEFLDFMADNNIVGGYGSQYKLIQRAGVEMAESDHALFLEDAKAFRSTSRWDGMPLAGESFAAFSLSTTAPATSTTFAEDTANAENP